MFYLSLPSMLLQATKALLTILKRMLLKLSKRKTDKDTNLSLNKNLRAKKDRYKN